MSSPHSCSLDLSANTSSLDVVVVSPDFPASVFTALAVHDESSPLPSGLRAVLVVASVGGDHVSAYLDVVGPSPASAGQSLRRIGAGTWGGKAAGILKGLHDLPVTACCAGGGARCPSRRCAAWQR